MDLDIGGADPLEAERQERVGPDWTPGSVYQIVRNRTSGKDPRAVTANALTVRIERIVAGGNGIGFADGRVVLVPMTAPGDLVEVRIGHAGPLAEMVRLVEPGPNRSVPECRHYGVCGGCNLMHLNYSAQVHAKREIVVDALQRIAGTSPPPDFAIVPSPAPFGTRARATWRPASSGRPGYRRRGSNETIEIIDCPILEPALEHARLSLSIDRKLTCVTNGRDVSLSEEDSSGSSLIDIATGNSKIRTHAGAFFQSNVRLLKPFVQGVIAAGDFSESDTVWDLYAGVGLFTFPVAARVRHVVSVESDSVASSLARENAHRLEASNVRVHAATADDWLQSRHAAPNVVIVDPPRVGLSKAVVEGLVRWRPPRIVYVSCDPPTFARDLARLAGAGYRMASLTGFDMFPQTSHVELVARLEGENA